MLILFRKVTALTKASEIKKTEKKLKSQENKQATAKCYYLKRKKKFPCSKNKDASFTMI